MHCIGPHWGGMEMKPKAMLKGKPEKIKLSVEEEEEDWMPELLSPSSLLSAYQLKKLVRMLPARVQLKSWKLRYSTANDGFSLRTLYRKTMESDCDELYLLVVKDSKNNVFGAMLTTPPNLSRRRPRGTPETFLWTFSGKPKKFAASFVNHFFHEFTTTSLAVGCSSGVYGLWLDDSLYRGRTKACATFNSEPLTVDEEFIIQDVEVWSFC